jgi:hypothetical protein
VYKAEIVEGVANELYATEKALDAAIAQTGVFMQSMIACREPLEISAIAGAGAQAKAMAAVAALAEARTAIIAAHQELAKDHRRLGWGTYAAGPMDKPDDMERPPVRPFVRPDLRVA